MANNPDRHLYPLLFDPVLKDYIWGGRNLERVLGWNLPEGKIAESWEVAAHEDGSSVVRNGPYAGLRLTEVHAILGLDLIGRHNAWAQERDKFPLLVKLLDAQDKLSVQVHPDDEYAQSHEGNELGKTEMWVVLFAEPDARLIVGVRPGTSPTAFREAIADGAVERYLHTFPVRAGDFVCVPSGTVHAILGGLLIAEIQQNSNTTYRVFDWNRTQDGSARPLHVDKAMDVINFNGATPQVGVPMLISESNGVRRELLCRNRYFTVERVEMAKGSQFSGELTGDTLEIWGAIKGGIDLNGTRLPAVGFSLLPAALGPFTITAAEETTCLRTYVEKQT